MNIIVDLDYTIKDGTEVVFRSPVDCSQVTGLKVYHPDGSQEFALADAHGNDVGQIAHLFAENVAVKVILDVTTGMAFVQNADTNAYLEGRFNQLSIINEASGSVITLNDSSNRELQGLKIYGKDTPEGTVGESGHVTVKIGGKNIADLRKFSTKPIRTATATATKDDAGYGTTLSATTGNSVTVTQSKWPNTTMLYNSSNGFVVFGFYCPLRVGNWATISFDYEITNNPLNVVGTDFALQWNTGYQNNASVKNNRIYESRYIDAKTAPTADGWNYLSFALAGTSGVISNFQVAYGKAVVDYEPYQEPQTLVVSTPNGLQTGEVLEVENANTLHTYKPNTTIINDAGAEMSVEYVADTKAYIDNKFTELQNAILASGANV